MIHILAGPEGLTELHEEDAKQQLKDGRIYLCHDVHRDPNGEPLQEQSVSVYHEMIHKRRDS